LLSFDEIAGQGAAVEMLRGLLGTGRIPHALLFHGSEGVGKATAARVFAAALVCERDGELACGRCSSCSLLESGNHPDMLVVGRLTRAEIRKIDKKRGRAPLASHVPDAAEGDLGAQILVDQIRKLTELVGLRPRQGRRRVFLVDPAERMNREAQNALLKTLEEPPERTVLILVSGRPHLLLPTVRSRCFSVGFADLRAEDLVAVLEAKGVPAEEAEARAALAEGSVGRALSLDLDERRERRREIYEMLETLSSGPSALEQLPAMAASLAGKDEPTLLDGLRLLQGLLRDAARAGSGSGDERLLHADLAPGLIELSRRLGSERAAVLVRSVDRLRGDLRFNTNRVLIAEALLAAVAGGPLP
jgi:DNA polymerase-3 subunit delta'